MFTMSGKLSRRVVGTWLTAALTVAAVLGLGDSPSAEYSSSTQTSSEATVPEALELSGLIASPRYPNWYWAHSDTWRPRDTFSACSKLSGPALVDCQQIQRARLWALKIDPTTHRVTASRSFAVSRPAWALDPQVAQNNDWEDIALGPRRADGRTNLVIAAIGDSKGNRVRDGDGRDITCESRRMIELREPNLADPAVTTWTPLKIYDIDNFVGLATRTFPEAPKVVRTVAPFVVWLALTALLSALLAVLYRFAKDRTQARRRWITWGAIGATALWLAMSAALFAYVQRLGGVTSCDLETLLVSSDDSGRPTAYLLTKKAPSKILARSLEDVTGRTPETPRAAADSGLAREPAVSYVGKARGTEGGQVTGGDTHAGYVSLLVRRTAETPCQILTWPIRSGGLGATLTGSSPDRSLVTCNSNAEGIAYVRAPAADPRDLVGIADTQGDGSFQYWYFPSG